MVMRCSRVSAKSNSAHSSESLLSLLINVIIWINLFTVQNGFAVYYGTDLADTDVNFPAKRNSQKSGRLLPDGVIQYDVDAGWLGRQSVYILSTL